MPMIPRGFTLERGPKSVSAALTLGKCVPQQFRLYSRIAIKLRAVLRLGRLQDS